MEEQKTDYEAREPFEFELYMICSIHLSLRLKSISQADICRKYGEDICILKQGVRQPDTE